MTSRGDVLREVMLETSTTQSDLSRLSGVRQPSISGFLSGRVDLSDDQLERLLSCMGYRLEVVRRPVVPTLNRDNIQEWRPTIERNLERLSGQVTGQPHERNLQSWRDLVDRGDLPGLHRVLTGLDRDSIEMREISPMGGLLTQEQRSEAMVRAS